MDRKVIAEALHRSRFEVVVLRGHDWDVADVLEVLEDCGALEQQTTTRQRVQSSSRSIVAQR